MKRRFAKLLLFILIILAIIFILNINVTTQQGINYNWRAIKIPLYLKALDFVDRHYNYKQLLKNILKDNKNEEDKIINIFKWTYENIKKTPEGFPIIDDHVWNIIIRGYGVIDQSSDVFTTLCNYAGNDAFFSWAKANDNLKEITLSFVKIKNQWFVFDPYNGAYFKGSDNRLISLKGIKSGDKWNLVFLRERPELYYSGYIASLPDIETVSFCRSNIQSPVRRFIFEIKKWIK